MPMNAKLKSPMSSNRTMSAIGRKKTEFSANYNRQEQSSSSDDENKTCNQFETVGEEEDEEECDKNSLVGAVEEKKNELFNTFIPQTAINNSVEEETFNSRSKDSSVKLYDIENMPDKDKESFYRKSSLAD